jgi:ABC-type polysaccharide/polyol phosphate export permease
MFRRKFVTITLAACVGPLLYLAAFGWGLGGAIGAAAGGALMVGGVPYVRFVLPGIIAMNGMTAGFGVIANDINMARVYQRTFETVAISPVGAAAYTAARVCANVLRCLYNAALIVAASFLFRAGPRPDWYFALLVILNCAVFSSAGFAAGMLVNSHADMARLSSFVITPMSFLCGTFFPLDRFPAPVARVIGLLPLAQTVKGLRAGAGAGAEASLVPVLALLAWLAVLLPLAILLCKKTE